MSDDTATPEIITEDNVTVSFRLPTGTSGVSYLGKARSLATMLKQVLDIEETVLVTVGPADGSEEAATAAAPLSEVEQKELLGELSIAMREVDPEFAEILAEASSAITES